MLSYLSRNHSNLASVADDDTVLRIYCKQIVELVTGGRQCVQYVGIVTNQIEYRAMNGLGRNPVDAWMTRT
jgi:hypothetical protein